MSSHGEPMVASTEVLKMGEIEEGKGRYPSRVILHKVRERTYATHIEVLPPGAEPYFILGRYFFSLDEAERDFCSRTKEIEGF